MNVQKNVFPEIRRAIKELKEAKALLGAKKAKTRIDGLEILHNLGVRLGKLEFADGFHSAIKVIKGMAEAGFPGAGILKYETGITHTGPKGTQIPGTWVTAIVFVPSLQPKGKGKKGKV